MKTALGVLFAVIVTGLLLVRNYSLGETPYTPAVPAGNVQNYGGWGGYGGGTTAAGSAMQGMASCVQAAGNYNLSTSAAAINMTVAERNQIQNSMEFTNTYFQKQQANRAAQAAQRRPPMSPAEMARWSQASRPKPLAAKQLDPVSGKLAWPYLLQAEDFSQQRTQLDSAFVQRARYGAMLPDTVEQVGDVTDAMLDQLRGMIHDVKTSEYLAAKTFVERLAYEAKQPAA
jgi:hypothetical protein